MESISSWCVTCNEITVKEEEKEILICLEKVEKRVVDAGKTDSVS